VVFLVREQVSGEQMSYLRSASRHPCVVGRRRGRCLASNLSCRRQYRHIIRPPTDTGPGRRPAASGISNCSTVPPQRRIAVMMVCIGELPQISSLNVTPRCVGKASFTSHELNSRFEHVQTTGTFTSHELEFENYAT